MYFARNIVLKMRNLPKIVLKTKIKNSPSPIDSMVELPTRRQLISSRHFRVGGYRCHNVPDCYVFLDDHMRVSVQDLMGRMKPAVPAHR